MTTISRLVFHLRQLSVCYYQHQQHAFTTLVTRCLREYHARLDSFKYSHTLVSHREVPSCISAWTIPIRFKSKHVYPQLSEADLEEDFVMGSGPGGQHVNRTMNCVVLKHNPTGIVVKCHETRSLYTNKKRARERLQERLDWHYHGDQSYNSLQRKEESENRKEKKRKTRAKLEKLRAFKEREGLDTADNS